MWSGLAPKADFGGSTGDVAEGPFPDSCSAANPGRLFDHLVGAATDGQRHFEPDVPGSLEIDYQFVFRRSLHRQIGRLLAFEDAVDIAGRTAVVVRQHNSVGD